MFATADRRVWSRGTTCATELLPPVAGVTMRTTADVARCSWQVHPEAVRVTVRRRLGTPPQGPADGSAVETTGTSFVDSGIAAGVAHCYAITAVYRGENGAERPAAAAFVTTTAQEPTAPVASLRAEPLPGDDGAVLRVRIVWRQKQVADVRIRLAREPCPWPFGTTVARTDLMSYGKELTGELTVRDGRAALVTEIPSGHVFLTPFSFGDDGALVGQDVDLGLTAPVGAVSYERRDDEVLLSWEWPARANAAEVRWAGDGGTGNRRITRGQRARDGGWARIPAGHGALRVEVRAIEVCPTGDAMSGARVVQVTGSERRLSYEIVWKPAIPGVGTRRVCTVRLKTENSCRGVTVVAIAKPGVVRPMHAGDGQEVARWHGDVGAGSVSTGGGAFFDVTVPRKFRKPYWLCCFLDDGVLADPAIAQMKVD